MQTPFLNLIHQAEYHEKARAWAGSLGWPFSLSESTPSPDSQFSVVPDRMLLICKPSVFSAAEKTVLEDALAEHCHQGAEITRPDPAYLPDMDFSIYSSVFLAKMAVQKISVPDDLEESTIDFYVPGLALIRRFPEYFHKIFPTRQPGLALALTEQCELGCRMCPFFGSDLPKEHAAAYNRYREKRQGFDLIPYEDIFRAMDLFSPVMPIRGAGFHGPGEPFRHPEAARLIEAFSERGLAMYFTTNGQHLESKTLDSLLRSRNLTLAFSVDALTEKVYQRIRPAGDFKHLHQVLSFLLERRQDALSPKIMVSFIRQEANETEEQAFIQKWLARGVEISVVIKYHGGQPVYPPEWRPRDLLPCVHLENTLHVLSNGDCWSCSAGAPDEFSLGNLFQSGPELILARQRNYAQKRAETGAAGPLCLNCTWWYQTAHKEVRRFGRLSEIRRPFGRRLITL